MKILGSVLAFVLLSASVQAQTTFTMHGTPQGLSHVHCTTPTVYTPFTIGTGLCPAVSFQTHWTPGSGSPSVQPPNTLTANLAHTHIECNLPYLAEVAGPFTVPCRFVLYHTAGRIGLQSGPATVSFRFDDPAQSFPLVGDPGAVLTWPFHLTFDPTKIDPTDVVPPHGYFVFRFMCRTGYDNGDVMDTQLEWSAFSVIDPSQPEPAQYVENEPATLTAKAQIVSARDTKVNAWGIHLARMIGDTIPLWAPFSEPVPLVTDSYSYGPDAALPPAKYFAVAQPDLHAGLPGVNVDFTASPVAGGSRNLAWIDPLVVSAAPKPAGFTNGAARLSVVWEADSDPVNPIPSADIPGATIAPGESVFSLVSIIAQVAPTAIGCTPLICAPVRDTNALLPNVTGLNGPAPPPQPTPTPVPTPTPTPTPSPVTLVKLCALYSDGSQECLPK